MLKPTLKAIAHTYGYVVDIRKNPTNLWAKHRHKENQISLNWIFDDCSMSKPLPSINWSPSLMYDGFAYDEDTPPPNFIV